MDANPDRSTYAFCIDTRKGKAGYFYLCFKANRGSPVMTWDVRVIPKGYELLKIRTQTCGRCATASNCGTTASCRRGNKYAAGGNEERGASLLGKPFLDS